MKKTRRTAQVGKNLRDALVEVFRHDLKDVDLGLSSITDVEVSPDLHYARVFLSGLEEQQTRETVKALQGVRGKVRHYLGQRIHLRVTPELEFKYDDTTARAGRIEQLLQEHKPNDDRDDDQVPDGDLDHDDDQS